MRTMMRLLATMLVCAGLAVAMPEAARAASCSGYGCDGKDAAATGCDNTITARSAPFQVSPNYATGTIELRYSRTCRTVWARIQIKKADFEKGAIREPYAQVHRNGSTTYYRCKNLAWSSTTGSYTCYTMMLNDAGLLAFANGETYYYNARIYAETESY